MKASGISVNKIKVFVNSKIDSKAISILISIFLIVFKFISNVKVKVITLIITVIALIMILPQAHLITKNLNLYYAVLIVILLTLIVLISDNAAINIADYFNPHLAALLRGLKISNRLNSAGFPIFIYRNVIIRNPEKISIGNNVTIYEGAALIAGRGYIKIGDNSHIDSYTVIHGSGGVEIGSKVAIASGVIIYSQSNQYKAEGLKPIIDQPILYKKVVIEDDVWIGAGAVILPGVKIRKGAIVGAGAVVPIDSTLEEYTIYIGIPARPLKKRVE